MAERTDSRIGASDQPQPVYKNSQRQNPGRPGKPAPRTLRELRTAAGITLAVLGELSGVHIATLSQIERGRVIARPEEAERIARALSLPPNALVTRSFLVQEAA